MGYTSSRVKNRWNKKHYDGINIRLPIGCRAEIQSAAKKRGMSMASFIRWAVLQAVSPEERKDMHFLSGRTTDDIENGYVSPFPPPPPKDGTTD